MLKYLSKKYINYKISGNQKNIRREKRFFSWDNIKGIVLLYPADEITANQLNFLLELFEGKKVMCCGYTTRDVVSNIGGSISVFGKKSVSILSMPANDVCSYFSKVSECDILIDLSREEHLPLKYLLSISKSGCRCGLKKQFFDKLYDFEVVAPSNIKHDELIKMIISYLKIIKSK